MRAADIDWLSREREIWDSGIRLIAGVDEAGRGPLAGPVMAAAVILRDGRDIPEAMDSKRLTPGAREFAYRLIREGSLAVAVSAASTAEIDRLGILEATMTAMRRAVLKLAPRPEYVLVDGNRYPDHLNLPGETIVGGDGRVRSIAAASIIAKVTRDRLMSKLGRLYPDFGFGRHKGYATREHLGALLRLKPTVHHRFSFAPVRQRRLELDMGR